MSAGNIDEEKQNILLQFRKNLEDVLTPSHDDRFLLRWLRARDFHLENAEAMLRNDLQFRKKMGSDHMVDNYKLKEIMQPFDGSAFLGFSDSGHPVRFLNIGGCDLKGISRCMTMRECTEYFIHMMEIDMKRLKENNAKNGFDVETCILLADFKGVRSSHLVDKKVVNVFRMVIHMFQDHYPETLELLFIINVPRIFPYFFNMIKSLFNKNVLRKICIYGNNDYKDDVFSKIPKRIVPAYVGGERYGPNGDPLCHDILNWKPKVPVEYYLNNTGSLRADDPGVCKAIVRRRSVLEIEQEVNRPGTVLFWEFQTKDYDIRFGLFYRRSVSGKKEAKTVKDELVPVDSVESHEVVEKGNFPCKKTGIYIFLFDNTYSWLFSKHLYYRIQLKNNLPTDDFLS